MRSCSTIKGVGSKYHRHRHHVSSTVEINTGSFQRNPKLTSEICSCVIIRVCIEIIAITS